MATLEVCVDSVAGLDACMKSAPSRIELCSALALGGLTPSYAFMQLAGKSSLPVYAMIRPRSGDFKFSAKEVSVMCDDIAVAVDAKLAGVVLGVSDKHNNLSVRALEKLVKAAGPLKKTLHRVIDTLNNPLDAMELAIDLGFDHILSSGGAASVEQGMLLLSQFHTQSAGRIDIVAGCGLTTALVEPIYRQTGISSFHSSCTVKKTRCSEPDVLGFSTAVSSQTDEILIKRYLTELESLGSVQQ